MMNRKEKVVQELVKGVEMLLQSHRVFIKYAHADLLDPHQVVLVDEGEKNETIEADAIILAPGSKSKILPGFSPDGEKIITSDEPWRLKRCREK